MRQTITDIKVVKSTGCTVEFLVNGNYISYIQLQENHEIYKNLLNTKHLEIRLRGDYRYEGLVEFKLQVFGLNKERADIRKLTKKLKREIANFSSKQNDEKKVLEYRNQSIQNYHNSSQQIEKIKQKIKEITNRSSQLYQSIDSHVSQLHILEIEYYLNLETFLFVQNIFKILKVENNSLEEIIHSFLQQDLSERFVNFNLDFLGPKRSLEQSSPNNRNSKRNKIEKK